MPVLPALCLRLDAPRPHPERAARESADANGPSLDPHLARLPGGPDEEAPAVWGRPTFDTAAAACPTGACPSPPIHHRVQTRVLFLTIRHKNLTNDKV